MDAFIEVDHQLPVSPKPYLSVLSMSLCRPTVLFDQENFCVAQCQHCQRIGLTFRNLLLGFAQDEFINFSHSLTNINFEQSSVLMADGQLHLVINTGHPDIQISLPKADFDLFRVGSLQALRRLDLYQSLKNQAN